MSAIKFLNGKLLRHSVKFVCFILLFAPVLGAVKLSYAQSMARVIGKVVSEAGEAIPFSTISVKGTTIGVSSNHLGLFQITVPSSDSITLQVSSLGFANKTIILALAPGERKELIVTLATESQTIDAVSVVATQKQFGNIERIEHKDIKHIPNASGSFEAILKSMPGVSSANELSSQYSVRGGNFDENMVYVNDVEIYRPFLIRSGQQEGLSFINSDMVESVEFSAGGFNAEFGDKMSSVLNIRYRRPSENAAKAEFSLLGASALAEGTLAGNRFTHLTGIRYKTSEYLLGTLDEKGDYKPTFLDFQTNLNYRISPKLQLTLLGNYSSNSYQFTPRERETRFGTFTNALQLKVFYEGQEVNRFETAQGSLAAEYRPTESVMLKFIAGSYVARESETFDILGQYLINELDNTLGSSTYGDSAINVGIGGFLTHARNFLDVFIARAEHIGTYATGSSRLKWGIRFQREIMDESIREWELIDSSGYAIPYNGNQLIMSHWLKSVNSTATNRVNAFVQNGVKFNIGNLQASTTIGVRVSYWDYNKNITLSPRGYLMITPAGLKNLSFHLSGGYYHQPPIYKEFRDAQGNLNRNIRSQEAIHIVLGSEYQFESWNRPFKFQAEVYHKILNNIIPYKVDNVRVRYAGDNLANGYAQGIDLKINGELVEGAQSWASISIMRTYEDMKNDSYQNEQGQTVHPGYYPRPTDQRLGFGVFFQDYVPNRPNLRVHLSGHYGTGLPFSMPRTDRYDLVGRMPSYKRVDMGFTAILKDKKGSNFNYLKTQKWLESFWIGLEIFNLFDFNNTISYLWVQTVANQSNQSGLYAVPNYLTSRRLNLKLTATF